MPSRRRTLALLTGVVPATLPGCSVPAGPREARLEGVWLVNDRETRQEVRVRVTDGESTVFEETRTLGTFERPTPNDGNVTVEPSLDGSGEYVVTVAVDDESASLDTTTVVDGTDDCVLVRFTLTGGAGYSRGPGRTPTVSRPVGPRETGVYPRRAGRDGG